MATAPSAVTWEVINSGGDVEIWKISWLGAEDGGAVADQILGKIKGWVFMLITDPGATAPTDNYDITIEDEFGLDILEGIGANRHTSTTQMARITVNSNAAERYVNSVCTFKIANQGVNSALGIVYLFVRRNLHDG